MKEYGETMQDHNIYFTYGSSVIWLQYFSKTTNRKNVAEIRTHACS